MMLLLDGTVTTGSPFTQQIGEIRLNGAMILKSQPDHVGLISNQKSMMIQRQLRKRNEEGGGKSRPY